MTNYKVYEDNGGGVSMVIRDAKGGAHLFTNLELALNGRYGEGSVRDMIAALRADEHAWRDWDGYDPLPGDWTEDEMIDDLEGSDYVDLIAWSDGDQDMRADYRKIGMAGRALLGLTDEDE